MKTGFIKINLAKIDFWFCLVLIVCNLISRYPFLNTRDLSWDEPFSAFYSQFPVSQIISELLKGNNPPFYEIFLHFYTAVFGISEYALRMPSLIFSCITVALLFYAGRRLKGRWVGIFVALLFIFNNLQFFYSLAARMYALFSMLVAAVIYLCIFCYQEPEKKKYFYWLFAINVLLCYTHYFAGFVIIAEASSWLVAYKNKPFFKRNFIMLLLNGVMAIPLLFVFLVRASGFVESFDFKPPYPGIWKNVIMNLINGLEVFNAAYMILMIGLIIYLVVCVYRKRIEYRNTYFFVLLFFLFAIPLGITWYYGNTYPLFIDRYYLYATLPLFLFSAVSIATFYKPLAKLLVPLIFIYLLRLSYQNFHRFNTDYMLREWRGAALAAKNFQQAKPNTVILVQPLWADLGFSYYYDRKLFQSGNNYNEELRKKQVYRVWGSDSLVLVLNHIKGNDIVYYCDENARVDSTNDGVLRMLLRRGYKQDSAIVFPLCTSVILLHAPE